MSSCAVSVSQSLLDQCAPAADQNSLRAQSDHGILNHKGTRTGKDVYSQPCGCGCVAMHASVGFGSLLSTVHLPTPKPKTRGTTQYNTTHPTPAAPGIQRHRAIGRLPDGVRPQNRPLVILIPPAHTHPAILPLGDGSLCHPRGCGVWAVGFLHGSYLGVGWDGAYLTLCLHQPAQGEREAVQGMLLLHAWPVHLRAPAPSDPSCPAVLSPDRARR